LPVTKIKTPILAIDKRVYWKYMMISSLIVSLCAYVQYTFVMRIPMNWNDFIIPIIVGCFFGFLLARIFVLHRELVEAAHDPLTNLWGRRHFSEIFKQEVEAANRYGYPLSLTLFDVDDFKQINDSHGHNAGDVILKELATVLKNNQRGSDVYARWGGEEFLVLMPGTSSDEAMITAERLRKAIEETPFSYETKVTSSFGVSQYKGASENDNFTKMLHRADQALYQAKQKGKNCVVLT